MRALVTIMLVNALLFTACDDNTVEGDDPCDGITCSGNGSCTLNSEEQPFCECDQGYVWGDAEMLTCVMPPDTCDGVTCNNHGTCSLDANDEPTCECEAGFGWDGDNQLSCVELNVDYKPVIYLYPKEPTKVTVTFAAPEELELLYTYPTYGEDGWCVNAQPDGTLYACGTGVEYYALFWEGVSPDAFTHATGFVVRGVESVGFLEEKLAQLGLSRREANEFIMFWYPILEKNKWNFIHFAQKEWAASVPLDVTPAPDTAIRFLMLYTPLERYRRVPAQRITTPVREGFTLVEWGGRRISLTK